MEDAKIKDLIRKEKNDYYKKWRKNNKDKVKEHHERYWKKRVERKLAKENKSS